MDNLPDILAQQKRWSVTVPIPESHIFQLALEIENALSRNKDSAFRVIHQKAVVLLVLLCVELVPNEQGIVAVDGIASEAQITYSMGLAAIAEACIKDKSIARLAVSKFANLFHSSSNLRADTDFWVSLPRPICHAPSKQFSVAYKLFAMFLFFLNQRCWTQHYIQKSSTMHNFERGFSH